MNATAGDDTLSRRVKISVVDVVDDDSDSDGVPDFLDICPDVNRSWRLSTYGNRGIKIYSLEQKKSWEIQVPENSFIGP